MAATIITGRVLVVGEDAAAAQSFEPPFTVKGYAVERAADGEDALWKLNNGTYDAVFTDLDMRGISGLDLAEEVHDAKPHLPVFILSEGDTALIADRAAAAGVVGFMRKPVTPAQIADAAAQVRKLAPPRPAVQTKAAPSMAAKVYIARLRDIVLFLTAPFLGLFYILVFPVIGLGMFTWMGVKSVRERHARAVGAPAVAAAPLPPQLKAAAARPGIARTLLMMLGAVALGLAYGIVGPILGIGLVIWFAFDAWGKLGAKAIKSET